MKIVYQAYGIKEICEQTLFSSVSLLRYLPDNNTEIVVYTDQPEWFNAFYENHPSVHIVTITNEQIKKWRGEIDFVHRVKIEVLKDAASRFQDTIVYLDGDTYFKENPSKLFSQITDNVSLMHVRESSLANPQDLLTKKIGKFIKKNDFFLSDKSKKLELDTYMWNAGVIGVSHKNTQFFDEIISLTDQMYSQYQKHVMEQLAVSFVLQAHTDVLPSDHVIYHYWNEKPQYQQEIQNFFSKNTKLSSALDNYDQFEFPVYVETPKVSGFKKFKQKLADLF